MFPDIVFFFVVDAAKEKEDLVYFFKHEDGNITIMKSESATVLYPHLVCDYLGNLIT